MFTLFEAGQLDGYFDCWWEWQQPAKLGEIIELFEGQLLSSSFGTSSAFTLL
jgi:hypothetical protein